MTVRTRQPPSDRVQQGEAGLELPGAFVEEASAALGLPGRAEPSGEPSHGTSAPAVFQAPADEVAAVGGEAQGTQAGKAAGASAVAVPIDALEAILTAARTARGRERNACLQQWRDRLRIVPEAPAAREARARWLTELLQEGDLESLVGARRWTARATAAEALLSLGYPYALEIHPDDLEHLRAVQALQRPESSVLLAGMAVTACLLAIGGDAVDGQLGLLALAGGLLAPVMPGRVFWSRRLRRKTDVASGATPAGPRPG